MAITPQTQIRLIDLPLEMDNKNQLTFSDVHTQFAYFNSLDYLEIENASYQRRDNYIRFPAHIDDIIKYNYCMYKNENYTDRWFYAFITNMVYVNDNLTYVYIITDVWQTWQFDIQFKQSFVEREHVLVSDDIPGAFLFPENLETGEYVLKPFSNNDEMIQQYFRPVTVCAYGGKVLTKNDGTIIQVPQSGHSYNGIYSSITFILAKTPNSETQLFELLQESNNSDYIITIFTVPFFCVSSYPLTEDTYIFMNDYKESPFLIELDERPTNLDNYIPHNKKLLQYPYIYLSFNAPNSTRSILRYEDFNFTKNPNPSFRCTSEINPNPNVCVTPQFYKNQDYNNAENLSLSGYPTISYKTDTFNSWLAQNNPSMTVERQQIQHSFLFNQVDSGYNAIKNVVGSILSLDPR